MKRNVVRSLALVVILAGCASSGKSTSQPKVSVGTATAGGVDVELLVDGRVETGLTPVYVKLTAGGQPVTDAAVTFSPEMTMSDPDPTKSYTHGAPVLGAPALGDDGLYRVEVVFQMQSSAMGSWAARIGVARPGMAAAEALVPLTVADSGRAKVFMYTDPQTQVASRYVMSLNLDDAARVGLNPITVTLHRRDAMFTFTPVDDATFALDPQMPSMGHGSPGSVSPTRTAPGVYEGLLSFSMAGDWETTVTVRRGDVVIGTPKFATTF